MSGEAEHCLNLVRDADKDRFLATLFAPGDKRRALLALYAFNVEVARIRDLVSEPALGQIRLQWWRETIEEVYRNETPAHPVAVELALAIKTGDLPKASFLNMIGAREFDLFDDPMPDLAHLEGYLGETSSALIQMASLILAGPAAIKSAEAAGLAGVAFGIANLLRDIRSRSLLPKDMNVAAAIAHARKRLVEARALHETIPTAAMPAFLPVSLTDLYLGRAAKPGTVSQLRRQLRLWRMARAEKF